jgi:tRNA-specific 2-thiouridylase
MADFLEKKIKPKKGLVKDTSWNILWEHKWVFYYTIWQRKWIDIWGQSEAIFVVKKDLEKNEIIVWTSSDLELYDDELIIKNVNLLSTEGFSPLNSWWWWKAKCKIRYRQADQDCEVIKIWEDEYKVKFKEKQRAIARWQICAIYLWDELVMSGVIQ